MVKFLIFFVLPLALALWLFLFPSTIRLFLRRLGRWTGDFGRAGQELVTGEEVPGSPLARYEALAGRAVEEKLLAAHPISSDERLQGRLAFIGARLAGAASRRQIAFRFRAVEGPEPAAYSLPGGAVLVSRPLVELTAGDDNQLAGILAHEVAHIDQRHAVRSLARTAAARTGLRILSLGRGALLARVIGSMEELLEKGYGAAEEIAADRGAVDLAARAGFDPRAYPFFLKSVLDRRLEGAGYFRSHPPIPERLRALGA